MVFRELTDEQYRALGVLPMSSFPDDHRAYINMNANQESPPPRWQRTEFTSFQSRSWFEWHIRRQDRDPRLLRAKLSAWTKSRVIERDRMVCGICKQPIESRRELHIDHVIPRARGGGDQIPNLQCTHAVCNLKKGARLVLG